MAPKCMVCVRRLSPLAGSSAGPRSASSPGPTFTVWVGPDITQLCAGTTAYDSYLVCIVGSHRRGVAGNPLDMAAHASTCTRHQCCRAHLLDCTLALSFSRATTGRYSRLAD